MKIKSDVCIHDIQNFNDIFLTWLESVCFNGHSPGEPGLLMVLRMMEVVMTTGAIRRAKLQSHHHHQQTNTQLYIGRMPFLSPNQQCQSTD